MSVGEWFTDFFEMDGAATSVAPTAQPEDEVSNTAWSLGSVRRTFAVTALSAFCTLGGPYGVYSSAPNEGVARVTAPDVELVAVPFVVPPERDEWLAKLLYDPSEDAVAALAWLT